VTLSLDAWTEGSVAPTTHTIAIVRPKAAAKPEPVSTRLIRSLVHPERKANLYEVQYSNDGARLFVFGYPSGVLQFWDIATGKELRRINTPAGYRGSAEYAKLSADWSTVFVPYEKSKVVRYEKDDKRDVRYEYEGEVLVYDAATGKPRPSLKPAPGRGVVNADLSPDGRKLIAVERSSYDRQERINDVTVLWDTKTAAAKPLGPGYGYATFTSDSKHFALCLTDHLANDSVLKLCDASGADSFEFARVRDEHFSRPRFSPDGRLLVVAQSKGRIDKPGTLRLWDLQTRKELASFKSGGAYPFLYLAYSPDSKLLAATDYKDAVHVWDLATGKAVLEKSYADRVKVWRVVFSPDGKRLAVGGAPKWDRGDDGDPDPQDMPQPRVFLFDLSAPTAEPEIVICPHGYLGGLAFSPDGKMLAVGGAGAVHLFDVTK